MAVVTTVYDSTCKVCDVVRYQLYKAFIYVQRSRQLSANERIFQDIKGFDREAGYHLANMNDATNKKYAGFSNAFQRKYDNKKDNKIEENVIVFGLMPNFFNNFNKGINSF